MEESAPSDPEEWKDVWWEMGSVRIIIESVVRIDVCHVNQVLRFSAR
jgi:hypothetical protein